MRVALYLRVSTDDQTHEHQRAELLTEAERRGWEVADVYAEKVSGASQKRPELERLVHDAALSRFKVLFVWRVDRLGRSVLQLVNVLDQLERRGVQLVSHRDGIDTTTPMGKAFFHIAGVFAELERNAVRERTVAGLNTARRKGKTLGRPRKASADRVRYLLQLNAGAVAATARQLGVSVSTVQRAARGGQKGPGVGKGTPHADSAV